MEVSGFPHQVGGHFGLLSIPGHVCKPLNQREYDFYTKMDPRLTPFTAKLCSRIKVQCIASQADEDGSLVMSTETMVNCHRLTGIPPSSLTLLTDPPQSPLSLATTTTGFVYSGANSSSTSTLTSCSSYSSSSTLSTGSNSIHQRPQPAMTFRLKSGRVEAEKSAVGNLWAGQCQSKVVQKLLKGHDRAFILLEDLVANYARPCVIDLKMGTRQYGDDASAQKRLTQTQKCRHSTSSIFGVRLVGMQLYDPDNEEYMFVNKYEGRRMDRVQFHNSLLQFFKMAGKKRTRQVIDELLGLRKVLVMADGFRFFSSSLLIAYNGEQSQPKMPPSKEPSSLTAMATPEITVKMIDFAHSTFNGFLEDAPYMGIDEGYLLGIDSLINFLNVFLQSGFKPIGTVTPGQLSLLDAQPAKRTPLKRKLENGSGEVKGGGGLFASADEEESSVNSLMTSGDSGTEMADEEGELQMDEEEDCQGLVVNILPTQQRQEMAITNDEEKEDMEKTRIH